MTPNEFIALAIAEDVQTGDYSTLSCIPPQVRGKAVLKIKEAGILAGVKWAELILNHLTTDFEMKKFILDGTEVKYGDIAFEINASVHVILKAERLLLNIMQRMSGIATLTNTYVQAVINTNTKILDTRKTTPLFRTHEKEAVLIGGGKNHRFGLFDMVMLKDNHVDFSGGVQKAIIQTRKYLSDHNLDLKIEIETRNIEEVKQVLAVGGVDRIMLDNFKPSLITEALDIIKGAYETEASGGINLENIASYAATGVDYISVGALTHHAVSLDISLKAEI